jgi:hypothetical protein
MYTYDYVLFTDICINIYTYICIYINIYIYTVITEESQLKAFFKGLGDECRKQEMKVLK